MKSSKRRRKTKNRMESVVTNLIRRFSFFNLTPPSVGKSDSGKLLTSSIESVATPRASNASFASSVYWSNNVLLICFELDKWDDKFRKRRSWSIARANVSAWFPVGLSTEAWKRPSGMDPRGSTYNLLSVLRLPLLSGKANVRAKIVAWNNAVQSHSS